MDETRAATSCTATLRFLGIEVLVDLPHPDALKRVFRFFSSHFEVSFDRLASMPAVTLRVVQAALNPDWLAGTTGEDVFVRKSAVEFFTIPATRWRSLDQTSELFLCPQTGTEILFDQRAAVVSVRLGNSDTVKEELLLIELIRDLFLKEIENRGNVVLHATCAVKPGSCLLIPGAKGAGKTSTLVELALNHGYSVVSGDKTILWMEDGHVRAAGWPDYPHLGLGTLSRYPVLLQRLGMEDRLATIPAEELWSMDHKVAIDYELFQELIPHIGPGAEVAVNRVVLPRVSPAGGGSVETVTLTPQHLAEFLETVFDASGLSWNQFLPRRNSSLSPMVQTCLQAICALPCRTLEGAADRAVWEEVAC